MIRTVGSLEYDDCCELHLAKQHQELNKSIFKTTYQKELKYAPIKTENQEKKKRMLQSQRMLQSPSK